MKRTNHSLAVLALWCVVVPLKGQFIERVGKQKDPSVCNPADYQSLDAALQLSDEFNGEAGNAAGKKKSPLLAGALSIALPGAGQYYTESYWEAAAFVAAEAALWIAYAVKTKAADQQTDEYQRYADEHFSVVRYAYWMRDNYSSFYDASAVPDNASADVAQPWNHIDWGILNQVEDRIGQASTAAKPTGFSHRLPARPEQQYFELIGKYPQFGGGWDDAGYFLSGDVISDNVSARFLLYRQMRGDANALYNFATGASFVLLANHVLSAVHAAWSASRWNHSVEAHAHLRALALPSSNVVYAPEITITARF